MRGDFSRLTFNRSKHYRHVLMQQGRVKLDADGNEQLDIDAYVSATTNADVIGAAGYPIGTDASGNPLGGFALGIADGMKDLTISPGRMYVDGLLVENDGDASLLAQPDDPGTTLESVGGGAAGVYLVYLETYERLVTALDDPHIRETALGGPDTSVRGKQVWRVRLSRVGDIPQDDADLPTCATVTGPWVGQAGTGKLVAGSGGATETLPCMLPPEAGYARLENQLYRVEVHQSGNDGAATFKWSRENGSVAVLITAPPGSGDTVTGPTLTVQGLSDDLSLGLQAGDWVELVDDLTDFGDAPGQLFQVATTPTDGRTVVLSTGSTPTATRSRHAKLRRWDMRGAGLDNGIPITPGSPIDLEGGVQVTFGEGTYRSGDYWLITARTATSVQQGYVDWPVDGARQPTEVLPQGIARHYAKLGLVEINADGNFVGLGTADEPTDCRLPFTPLTGLHPTDTSGPCTIVVSPGPGWEVPVLAWFQAKVGNEGQHANAEICFPVGDFPVSKPVVISGAGHVRVNGAGWGTHLHTTATIQTVLRFDDCSSATVRDLHAEAVNAGDGVTSEQPVNGTLAFVNCDEVTVEDCWVRTGGHVTRRSTACVSIYRDAGPADLAAGVGSARVRGCLLHPGEMQVGVQLVHQHRAMVCDNEIAIDPSARTTTLGLRLNDLVYRSIARSYLMSGIVAGAASSSAPSAAAPATRVAADAAEAGTGTAAEAGAGTAAAKKTATSRVADAPVEEAAQAVEKGVTAQPAGATGAVSQPAPIDLGGDVVKGRPAGLSHVPIELQVGNQTLSAMVDKRLEATWQTYLNAKAPGEFATARDAATYLRSAADKILTDPNERVGFSAFAGILRSLQSHVPAAERGISVGGRGITDLEIANNEITGVLTGISVGLSHTPDGNEVKAHQRTVDQAVHVRILDNVVGCYANDVAVRNSRFGILVGNAASALVQGNCVYVQAMGISSPPPADGIRVVGVLGSRAVVRANQTSGFALAIRLIPLIKTGPTVPAQVSTYPLEGNYLTPIRPGPLYLIADNVIEGAAQAAPIGPWESAARPPAQWIDAQGPSVLVDNVVGDYPRLVLQAGKP